MSNTTGDRGVKVFINADDFGHSESVTQEVMALIRALETEIGIVA